MGMILERLRVIWQKLSIVQRAMLIGIVAACGITALVLTQWASKPDYALLFSNLTTEDAAKIVDKIQEEKADYKLTSGGTSIWVPREQMYQLRLQLAKEGLPSGGQKGYSIINDAPLGQSPSNQRITQLRAIQEELAMTIQMLEGVALARVHLVKPEQTLFTSRPNEASASVTIKLRPGYKLSSANIAAITHLVAGSVEGMKADNVTIVDSGGKLLSGGGDSQVAPGANTYMDYKERVEQQLNRKVQDMLERVLGPGKSTVQVSATLDMTSIDTQRTMYDEAKVPRKEVVSSTKKLEDPLGQEEDATGTKLEEKDETVEIEYAVPQTIERSFDVPGDITALSVSAMVDLAVEAPAVPEGDEGEQAAPVTPATLMSIDQVKQIIRNALGRDLLKEEALTVVNVPFKRTELISEPVKKGFPWGKVMDVAGQASLGVMAICALIVFKIFSKAATKNEAPEAVDENGAPVLNQAQGPVALLPTPPSDPAVLKQHIAGILQNNPEQVKKVFNNWIEESGS